MALLYTSSFDEGEDSSDKWLDVELSETEIPVVDLLVEENLEVRAIYEHFFIASRPSLKIRTVSRFRKMYRSYFLNR
ncbi:hypothetical protein ACPYIV_14510 [Parabacteroides sp. ASD2025]|uniref:hypothetical protein n=1 Tax=Parabacteroides sp. ASD2025 TaxID=3415987 RepID=UPI003CE9DF02